MKTLSPTLKLAAVLALTPAAVGGPPLVINEIHADPAFDAIDPLVGDANGDGLRDASEDEFIEIANVLGADMDISGWTLSDTTGVRHTFPEGTILADGCVVVVFGGGFPTGDFGGATVQTASGLQLGLNNGGDTIVIADPQAAPITVYGYGEEGNNDQSLTRAPDMSGDTPLVMHSTAPGSNGAPYSPGIRLDGFSFEGCAASPCAGDTDGDGVVGVLDLVHVITDWDTDGSANGGNLDDTGGSEGIVDAFDLLAVINAWGPCP